MKYCVLDIHARKCNMLQSQSVIAPAPVFAAVMAMHALDRRIEGGLDVQGVGIIHRSCQPWVEYIPNLKGYLEGSLVQRRGACLYGKDARGNAGPQENSAQPMALADIEWTLIIASGKTIAKDAAKNICNEVLNMRLAGGVIERCRVQAFDDLEATLKAVHGGFWVDEVSHEMDRSVHPVHALLELGRESAWTIPVNLGYALLESPAEREGSRDGAAHAFAENMLGLIRYTPLAAAKAVGIGLDRLWRYGWVQDQFIVTNQAGVALTDACVF